MSATNLPSRFWTKVNKTDSCWLWTASKAPNGYGQFWINGRLIVAHRVAFVDAKGDVADGLQLDHLCRVRHCVNPAHLEPVTPRVNNLRSPITNGGKTHCKHGHEYTAENTYTTPEGHRKCRACIYAQHLARNPEGSSGRTFECHVCGAVQHSHNRSRHLATHAEAVMGR